MEAITKNDSVKKPFSVKDFLIKNNTYVIFLVLFVACCLVSDTFLSQANIFNILCQQAGPILVALGMLFVVLTGGIDLSVGAVTALSTCCAYRLMSFNGWSFGAVWPIAIAVGLAMGAINGFLVAYCKMQGFVTTLATLSMGNGLALMASKGAPIRCSDVPGVKALAARINGKPISWIVIICAIIVVIMVLVQRYTAYGRIVIACGSNPTAVNLAGINVKWYVMSCYIVSGLLSSIGGMLIASRVQTAQAILGKGGELDAIAACVIGGASLAGGKGEVFKTVIGAFTIALIGNIMNLMGVPAYPQEVVKGIIIVAAVLLQIATDKKDSAV